ncbi:MAG TPA: hypothetical protein VFX28_11275, partial [Methylomirabilota bacterium]|nr:hypothetical protein [Methylomirabilota bacterium]
EAGFLDDTPPAALLYLLLRHALQLGFYDVGARLHEAAGLLSAAEARLARREPPFIHVAAAPGSESRYRLLATPAPAITGSPTRTVGDFVAATRDTQPAARDLREQLRAVERLAAAPTARLERALAEHVDCCTYRLDAWLLGLVHCQLAAMRGLRDGAPGPRRTGLYLGAYAWLEDVRPATTVPAPVRLSPDLAAVFERPGDPPLRRDAASQGYVHAPSLNQAVTAAVLRSGYLADASPANRQTLAVSLTSERVRVALAVLEGLRGGQSLGALLGYRFERGLHDAHGLAEVDEFIAELRRAFPLRANRLASTRLTPEEEAQASIEAIEARNVVDGLKLVEHVKALADPTYPFGRPLPPATDAQRAAIEAEVTRLLDVHDAVADLAMAEGVYQAVHGNYDRAAATLDAYGRGQVPPDPEVIRTPTSGIGLTHRVALHLEAGVDPTASPVAGVAMTPRATAEPALNRWLAGVLPPLGQVGCTVAFRDAAGAPAEREVTLRDLGLQPLDLLYLVHDESAPAMSELDDRIVRHAVESHAPRPDGGVAIRYLQAPHAPFTVFEVLPLVRSLRRLALSSRPLQAADLALANEPA